MRADVLVFDHSKFSFATLKAFLIQYGYTVVLASNFSEAQRKLSTKKFDLILVQDSIRKEELFELTTFLQQINADAFVFTFLKNYVVSERIDVLEHGVDDCLSVPYHPKELLLKLEKLLQHKHAIHNDTIKTNTYQLNVKSGDLVCPWGKIWLRKKEFMIMSLLLQQKNRVVTKEQIIERIWGLEETPQMSTIDVHIKRIRQKIKDAEKRVIKTAYGIGYMFCE